MTTFLPTFVEKSKTDICRDRICIYFAKQDSILYLTQVVNQYFKKGKLRGNVRNTSLEDYYLQITFNTKNIYQTYWLYMHQKKWIRRTKQRKLRRLYHTVYWPGVQQLHQIWELMTSFLKTWNKSEKVKEKYIDEGTETKLVVTNNLVL